MSNYNKVKTEGVETFRKRFSGMNLLHEHFIMPLKYPRIEEYLSTYAEKVHKATLEDNAQEIRNILNRCKTERGLGVAIANYIKTLTK